MLSIPMGTGSPVRGWGLTLCFVCSGAAGIPRSYVEAHEDYLRREAKQLKRENTPPRDLSDSYKVRSHEGLTPLKMKPAHEGLVATVKEAGRSIHEIPREELRRTPDISLTRPLKEGSITQVWARSYPACCPCRVCSQQERREGFGVANCSVFRLCLGMGSPFPSSDKYKTSVLPDM